MSYALRYQDEEIEMAYHRVTQEERTHIYHWRQEGVGFREIGRRLRRSASSITREIVRNTGLRGYRPRQAHEKALQRAQRPGPRRFTDEVRKDAEDRLKQGWTPEAISGRARLEGRPSVCKETIYKHVYADAEAGGDLWRNLPRSRRKRRRRCPRQDGRGRGRIPNQRMIDTRPAEVDTRNSIGHWEGDLINGANGTGNLVTMVERHSRYTLVGRTDSKATQEVVDEMIALFSRATLPALWSITLDNGKEFALHEILARETGMDVFFAQPYHSWERGTNENINGLIRRLHPKKSSFENIDEGELRRIESFVNDRPMKCLGWHTPGEVMSEFLGYAP